MILLTTTSLEYINTHKHKNVVAGKTNFEKQNFQGMEIILWFA